MGKEDINKKKILFLVMIYDKPLLLEEYDIVMGHYYRMKEKHGLDNVEIYGYTSGNEDGYNEEKHLYLFRCSDKESNALTYEKTRKMFKYAMDNLDFDYIYRTNTSTFTNLLLLDKFVQETDIKDNEVYCGDFYMRMDDKYNIVNAYGRGNSIIFPKETIKLILNEPAKRPFELLATADDDAFGTILLKNDIIYKQYWSEWFACITRSEDLWGNLDYSLNNLRRFICVQVRSYYNRKLEPIFLKIITEMFEKEYIYNGEDLIRLKQMINSPMLAWISSIFPKTNNEVNGYYIVDNKDMKLFKLGYNKKQIRKIKNVDDAEGK